MPQRGDAGACRARGVAGIARRAGLFRTQNVVRALVGLGRLVGGTPGGGGGCLGARLREDSGLDGGVAVL